MKVFVLEDDVNLVTTIGLFLELGGNEGGKKYDYICANTINDALAVLGAVHPDVALIDLMIHGEIAVPVLNKLYHLDTKVIIMSALGPYAKKIAREYGFELLSKPFDLEDLEKYLAIDKLF